MEENINCKELFCALFVNIVENTKVFPYVLWSHSKEGSETRCIHLH